MKFDFAKILDISKRYWVIIVFCVLMIAAMITMPVFVTGQQEALQKDLDAHKAVDDQISQVKKKQRHQPVVSLDSDAAAPLLTEFPNEHVIAAGEDAIKGVHSQSIQLKDDSIRINVHHLLVPGSLPDPQDAYHFKQIYLEQFIPDKQTPSVIQKELDAATPPTDEEIKLRADQETQRLTEAQPHNSATGEVYNKEALQQSIDEMLSKLPEQMRHEAATQHKMYMAPSALSIQPALAPPAPGSQEIPPDAEAIWLGQMGLWIQQDVVNAIVTLNAASTSVESSPVKQLVQIYVPPDRNLYVIAAATASSATPAAGAPAVPASSDTDAFPKDYTVSVTGRVSNGVFDVTQFYVVLNVQAPDVERVIQQLERDKLITVCESEVQAVNSAAMQLQGYYFGKTPIVTLTLRCEELFMRDWTHTLMPAAVKAFLNVDQQAGQGETAAQQEPPAGSNPARMRPQHVPH